MDPTDTLNAQDIPAVSGEAGTAVHHSLVNTSGEQCPSCGSGVTPDQRYCLRCGQRRGEPRLPFMNAVTFMDSMKRPTEQPAAPEQKRRHLSPNAALIAGVGTLLLAMGVGVLIGRAGNHTVAAGNAAPQVIRIPAGGDEPVTASRSAAAKEGGAGKAKTPKKKQASLKKEAESQAGAESVLKPSAGVKLPPATATPGSKCESGAAGCDGGEFTGNFFGE